jgi:RNA polymerase sigma factor for flagellar operon FliA
MDEAARKRLWDEYGRSKSTETREKLIIEYSPLVKIVAGRLSMYLGSNVEYDDLVGYGIFGLIDAIDKYDLMKEVKFETYASLRIRGAILDQIRKMDWIPRTIRQKQKQIDAVSREIETATGHSASGDEIADRLGITSEEYNGWQTQMKVTNVISLDEFMDQGTEVPNDQLHAGSQFESPEDKVERGEIRQMLASALDSLTEKERKVVLLYYYEDLTLKEISDVLEVSESRVSQLHTRAIEKMRGKLGNYFGILAEAL